MPHLVSVIKVINKDNDSYKIGLKVNGTIVTYRDVDIVNNWKSAGLKSGQSCQIDLDKVCHIGGCEISLDSSGKIRVPRKIITLTITNQRTLATRSFEYINSAGIENAMSSIKSSCFLPVYLMCRTLINYLKAAKASLSSLKTEITIGGSDDKNVICDANLSPRQTVDTLVNNFIVFA